MHQKLVQIFLRSIAAGDHTIAGCLSIPLTFAELCGRRERGTTAPECLHPRLCPAYTCGTLGEADRLGVMGQGADASKQLQRVGQVRCQGGFETASANWYSQHLQPRPVEGRGQRAAQPCVVGDLKAAQVERAVERQPGGREGRARQLVVLQPNVSQAILHRSGTGECAA